MKTHFDCLPCIMKQTVDAARFVTNDNQLQEKIIRKVMTELVSYNFDESPPYISQIIHKYARELSGIRDPYIEVKEQFTQLGLELYDELKALVKTSPDSFTTALKLSIAGNIIDFGIFEQVSEELVQQTIERCLHATLPADSVNSLKDDIAQSGNILFLGDNAGETVFDRLFIEEMPMEKVTYVVKGSPIVNDATMKDAKEAGLTEIVQVIDNDSNAQGTILAWCSEDFVTRFHEADLIIAKGQAHYETTSNLELNCIYYLLQAKCAVIANDIGCQMGEMVVLKA
ncbi:MAG TPA: DUF89 family protein [Gelria sp.]|jgi:uncharacterized protein with ATP-grasp and redox domains|nr:DUF89 family protein [Gelria sp.]